MNMTNLDIRAAMTAAGMKQWQVAHAMGIHESVLCRKLRTELSQEEKAAILKVIKGTKEYDA